MSNFKKVNVIEAPRTELHDALGLTGAEISINHLPKVMWLEFHLKERDSFLLRKIQS